MIPMKSSFRQGATASNSDVAEAQPVAVVKPDHVATSLMVALQRQYKERWAILLDAIFSDQPSERIALQNAFLNTKDEGLELLKLGRLRVGDAADLDSAVSSRHVTTGLLTKFFTFPSAVLPALALHPDSGSSVLVLGKPSMGQLLTLTQLLFDIDVCPNGSSRQASLLRSRNQERPEKSAKRKDASIGTQQQQHKAPTSKSVQANSAPSSKHFEEYLHLPWHVYGEGPAPTNWKGGKADVPVDSLAVQIQQGLIPAKPPQGWSLGNLLTGVLQRGIRAGCCVVRTSSGDWAEACALEEQKAAQQSHTPAPSAVLGASMPCTGKSCFGAACLGDEADGHYQPFQDQQQPTGDGLSEVPGGLHVQMPPDSRPDIERVTGLLGNHVPGELNANICVRDEAPESGQWWRTVTNGSFDCVVVNAEASATKAAVLEACQSGNRKPWLREEVQTRLDCHRQIICDSFSALRPGGHLLFCSNSLAYEETDGLVQQCITEIGGHACIMTDPCATSSETRKAIAIAMKKWGTERTALGWRLLPDLAFQTPQYFSIIHRI